MEYKKRLEIVLINKILKSDLLEKQKFSIDLNLSVQDGNQFFTSFVFIRVHKSQKLSSK